MIRKNKLYNLCLKIILFLKTLYHGPQEDAIVLTGMKSFSEFTCCTHIIVFPTQLRGIKMEYSVVLNNN